MDLDTVLAVFKLLVITPATRPYVEALALRITSSMVLQCFYDSKFFEYSEA